MVNQHSQPHNFKALNSPPAPASRVAQVLERLPGETEADFQAHCLTAEQFLTGVCVNPGIEVYKIYGHFRNIKWDSIPDKDWNRHQCIIWIRTYLMEKICLPAQMATEMTDRFYDGGNWLICMGRQDWVKLCWMEGCFQSVGGHSLWKRIEKLKEQGLIDGGGTNC
ncbi:hypothetical protein BDZ45DRAFT_734457 [Acephala macrosclerotiorum]|nr:hypothetical protein BDZ45DRAFT_734457 [Acephala macrosclerotiorum]